MSEHNNPIAGLVGGLGPDSTIDYYRRLFAEWQRRFPASAPPLIIDSLDVQRALRMIEHEHAAMANYLLESLARLHGAGASFAAITANTAHVVFGDVAARSPLPLISIVEVCAEEAVRLGLKRFGLLGSRFTMEGAFYPEIFASRGLTIVRPAHADLARVHQIYMTELLKGTFRDESRAEVEAIVHRMRSEQDVDAIILGGTELPLLLPDPTIAGLPVLDTTQLHVSAIIDRIVSLS